MHQYLKAIGFSNITTRRQERELLEETEEDFSSYTLAEMTKDCDFCEFVREYGIGIGVKSCGEINDWDEFEREYYFPYFEGSGITSYADVVVEKKIDQEAYLGICEDARVGVSIIFQLQNNVEYMKEYQLQTLGTRSTSVTLAGLANRGKILLPIVKNEAVQQAQQEEAHNRMMLLSAARQGDSQALESLTLDDIDTYSKVSQRIGKEDVLSIVATYFMPYGLECTLYSILGEILDMQIVVNDKTNETLYILTLNVNDLHFDVCVPMAELSGEPEIGRRFKGEILLQGRINFQ